ncbi:sugar nucleotide-binding protein [Akkermansiaceae bacterium]|nr:sugar nucleotide-binding protein [Akkermansiaceae bacterium]
MIILLGGSGYVGNAFQKYFEQSDIEFLSVARSQCDYTDKDALNQLLKETNPDFLINTAGYTGKPNVDACELHKAECLDGNAVLPGTILEVCESHKITWGQVSSGCIYTGRREDGEGFTEDDTPNFSFRTDNCSFYSGTKALGEEVLDGAENCYIWRLRIPFNHVDSPRNYLSKLINYDTLLEAENSISHIDEFVRCCSETYSKQVPFGTYNVTNTGYVTTHEVADLIKTHLLPNKEAKFFSDEDEFMKLAAKTPRSNCVMDNSKLRSTGIEIREVHEAVIDSLQNWKI